MSKRQSDLHGNMQSEAEMTSPTKRKFASKYDYLYEKYTVEEIHRLHFDEGMKPPQLSEYTGIPRRQLVQKYFYDLGIQPETNEKGKHPKADDVEWLVEQLKTGKSYAEIARDIDRKACTVGSWLKKHGIDATGNKINKSLRKIRPNKIGENNPAWKGGRTIAKNTGYILIHKPEHPNAKKSDGYILEHRLVMSEFLGRPLFDWEIVHHKNGNKQDNRITNLELRYKNNHPPMKDSCCPNCGYELRWL